MELVASGKVTKAFGRDGEVIALLYDSFPADFDIKEPLYIRLDGLAVPFFISRFEKRGRSSALIVLDDIDSEQRAAIVIGQEFFLPSPATSGTPDSRGLSEFTGYTAVVAEEGSGADPLTGIITGITGNEHNPLFSIETSGREILVPAVEDMVTGIDPGKRTIWLEVPPGLLEL